MSAVPPAIAEAMARLKTARSGLTVTIRAGLPKLPEGWDWQIWEPERVGDRTRVWARDDGGHDAEIDSDGDFSTDAVVCLPVVKALITAHSWGLYS